MAADFSKFDDAEPLSPKEERLKAKIEIENEAWKMKGMKVSRTEFAIQRMTRFSDI